MSSPHLKKLATYEAANQECARIVLADPEKFGGETALLVMWARLVLKRPETTGRSKVCGSDRPAFVPSAGRTASIATNTLRAIP